IVDPGCQTRPEQEQLDRFIQEQDLSVQAVLNTHCHVDHVFGNRYVCDTYNCDLLIHKEETPLLHAFPQICKMYGLQGKPSPEPTGYLVPGEVYAIGDLTLEILFTPGHSPASVCLLNRRDRYILVGDVLFNGSIGRTDLPGGDFDTLMESIQAQLMPLEDNFLVYPGHGPQTSIGVERTSNPFLLK
ncbi:MAG: MBL fold metallo-hydrolase, partial [Saprospiraceae bacterium]|nr:MBL fold metallo-hydrolase [Saprospiraceae bacterium]